MSRIRPDTIVMSPIVYYAIKAAMDNQGRDWRRIKREIRKATKRAKKATRAKNEQAQ